MSVARTDKVGNEPVRFQSDESVHRLTGQLIFCTNDGSLSDATVLDEGRLNLRSR